MEDFIKPKITLLVASSLDGYIDLVSGGIKWSNGDRAYLKKSLENSSCVLVGESTYNKMKDGFLKDSFPKDLITVNTSMDLEKIYKSLEGKEVLFLGGTRLSSEFFKRNYVSNLILCLEPIFLGDGMKILSEIIVENLSLEKVERYDHSSVRLFYNVG